MKKVETKTTYKCDICHTEYEPYNIPKLPVKIGIDNHTFCVKMSYDVPWAGTYTDICQSCASKYLRELANEIESLKDKK